MYEQGKVKRFNEKKLKRTFSIQVLRKEHGSETSNVISPVIITICSLIFELVQGQLNTYILYYKKHTMGQQS